MATIADKLSAIIGQKSDMVKNLNIKGVSSASDSEKFNTLVAKVLTVGGKNQYVKPGTGNTSSPTLNQKLGALYSQKNLLATYLTSMGVPASTSEKLNTLVPKILEIPMVGMFIHIYDSSDNPSKWKWLRTTKYTPSSILTKTDIDNILSETIASNPYTTSFAIADYVDGEKQDGFVTSIDNGTLNMTYLYGLSFSNVEKITNAMFINKMSDVNRLTCAYLPKCSYIDESIFKNTALTYTQFVKLSKIPSYAFENTNINLLNNKDIIFGYDSIGTILNINDSNICDIVELGDNAFNICTELYYLPISPNINIIPSYTFNECRRLACVYPINGSIMHITAYNGSSTAFTSEHYVDYPQLSKIMEYAFSGTEHLFVSFNTPLLAYVGSHAFDTTGLIGIDVTNVSYIGDYAFANNPRLSIFNGSNNCILHMPKCSYIGELAFARSRQDDTISTISKVDCSFVSKICDKVFFNQLSISDIYIPSCKEIGAGAFGLATNVSVKCNTCIHGLSLSESCSFGSGCFLFRYFDSDIYLPNNDVSDIPDNAFSLLPNYIVNNMSYYHQRIDSISTPIKLTIRNNKLSTGSYVCNFTPFYGQPIREIVYTGPTPSRIDLEAVTIAGKLSQYRYALMHDMVYGYNIGSNFQDDIETDIRWWGNVNYVYSEIDKELYVFNASSLTYKGNNTSYLYALCGKFFDNTTNRKALYIKNTYFTDEHTFDDFKNGITNYLSGKYSSYIDRLWTF